MGLARCGAVFPGSVVVGAAVPAAVCPGPWLSQSKGVLQRAFDDRSRVCG